MAFREKFEDAPFDGQAAQGVDLVALMLTLGLLITPSMTHQVAYRGEDRKGLSGSHPSARAWPEFQ
jgi:hypothetical protein